MAQVGNVVTIDREPGEYSNEELTQDVLAGHCDRRLAAEILRRLAKEGDYGGYPVGIPPEAIGRALYRLVTNWTPNPEAERPLETSVVEVIGRILAGFYDRPVR